MKRYYKTVKEKWRFNKDNAKDVNYMNNLILEKKNKCYEVFEEDFEDWDGGEIHYHDVTFTKDSYYLEDDEF